MPKGVHHVCPLLAFEREWGMVADEYGVSLWVLRKCSEVDGLNGCTTLNILKTTVPLKG